MIFFCFVCLLVKLSCCAFAGLLICWFARLCVFDVHVWLLCWLRVCGWCTDLFSSIFVGKKLKVCRQKSLSAKKFASKKLTVCHDKNFCAWQNYDFAWQKDEMSHQCHISVTTDYPLAVTVGACDSATPLICYSRRYTSRQTQCNRFEWFRSLHVYGKLTQTLTSDFESKITNPKIGYKQSKKENRKQNTAVSSQRKERKFTACVVVE